MAVEPPLRLISPSERRMRYTGGRKRDKEDLQLSTYYPMNMSLRICAPFQGGYDLLGKSDSQTLKSLIS